jgi:BirA family biotin operon repressor/biotin-[acetyl-CoA-carboxylase] ligase
VKRQQLNPSPENNAPVLLDASLISQSVGSYWRVKVLEEIGSTQTALATSQLRHGDLLAAEYQSAGRGRLDRTFITGPSTALTFSFYVEPSRERSEWGFLSLLAGSAVVRILNEVTQSNVYGAKWPNDILAGDKKIAGLLAEVHGDGVIIGIGINVTTASDELPVPTASSILLASQLVIDRNELLISFLNRFAQDYADWSAGNYPLERYRAVSSTMGHSISALHPDGSTISGRAVDISSAGALLLESGAIITVGDITHLTIDW